MARKPKQILSPGALNGLKLEQSEAKAALRAVTEDRYGAGTKGSQLDKANLEKQIRNYDKLIQDGSPKKVRGTNKDKLWKRSQDLEKFIKEGMPTYSEMNNLKKHPGSPRKNLKWERDKSSAIREYRQLMRTLEPGDPTASSIEKLRRNK